MVRQLVSDPRAFMDRKANEPNMRWEIVLVLLVGAMATPGVYYVGQRALEVSNDATMRFAVAGRIARPVIYAIVIWVAYTIALHFISRHYRGRGPIRRLFKGVAWSLVPFGIGNLVLSAGLFLAFQNVNVEEGLQAGATASDQLASLFNSQIQEPILAAATVFLVLTILASGYLMTFAVQQSKDLTRDQALRVVAIPVVLHVLYVLWTLVQGTASF